MDFNATIDLIIKDLDDARNIIDDLKRYPGVPVLQVELAKAKCKSAGEVISLLKSLKYDIPEAMEASVEPQHQKQPQLTEEKMPAASSLILNSSVDSNTTPSVAEKEEAKKSPKNLSESSIIADKFTHLSSRFNEKLGSQKSEDDLSDVFMTKPLSSLSDAIGVNDRFLFIREIFNDNKDAYTQAISQLDSSKSLADARVIIKSYIDDYDENKTVKQLLDLVKRKLTSNE